MLFGVVEVEAALIFEIILIFGCSLFGSFIYEAVGMIVAKSNKLSILKITASTIFASTFVFGLGAYVHMGFRELIIPSLIMGILGFQILIRMRTLEGFFSLLRTAIDLSKGVIGLIDSKIPKADKDEEETEIITVEHRRKSR